MKPFNLNAAIAGKPVVNSKGQKAYYRFTLGRRDHPTPAGHVFEVENNSANFAFVFDDQGLPIGNNSAYATPLFMATIKKTYYQNVYLSSPGGYYITSKRVFESAEFAKEKSLISNTVWAKYYTFVKTISFEIEE